MLPSSHLAPMIAADAGTPFVLPEQSASAGAAHTGVQTAMLGKDSAVLLADAFSEFISASARLENSYRELQQEVSELGLELTERNAALRASLVENERMRLALQQIVDSMPCGVLVLDRDGIIAMINPESGRLLGVDPTLIQIGKVTTLAQISVLSGINLESFYRDECSSDTAQEFCIHDSCRKRWLEIRNRRLFLKGAGDRGPRPDQTILILRDITAQKRAEQEREAGRKAMALAEITTILAHEIRNPLASLELFAGLLASDHAETAGTAADSRQDWISNLRAGIRSLAGTVNNVLSFHGSGSLQLTPVPLAALIDHALSFARPIADQAAVSLRWSGDPGEVCVSGNESALQQVVLNLVSNAVRYTSAGGSVTVSMQTIPSRNGKHGERQHGVQGRMRNRVQDRDHVIVEFRDTGRGIRPDQIARVFEPGFSGSGDSSGLGLAVCERIMKQHGGSISVSSRIDSGSVFVLDFPVLQLERA